MGKFVENTPVTCLIPKETEKFFKDTSKKKGLSKSYFYREALEEYVEKYKNKIPEGINSRRLKHGNK
ncbi:MAG: hypothetical protein ACRC0V_03815 [Fusobacteriaceae bacterium]